MIEKKAKQKPPPRTGKQRGPKKGSVKNPSRDITERRRARVETLWIAGTSIAEILRTLESDPGGQAWTRATVSKDLERIRERWEAEGSRRNRAGVRGELERMSRYVFKSAMSRTKPAVRRESDAKGKVVVTTVLIADPDLGAANRAVERLAALHGLNVTTLDGTLNVSGLSDLFGDLDTPDRV